MPITVTDRPYRPVPVDPPRKRWTRSECAALEATGIWNHQHLELIEGELIDKMGKNLPHMQVLTLVQALLTDVFDKRRVMPEASIDVASEDNPTSEPEPDLIVLNKSVLDLTTKPRPADLVLVIEISDSTLGFDLTTKAALYARAGIADYWVFDVPARRLIVHRDPQGGLHRSVTAYNEQESVSPLASPESRFRVSEAFTG